MLCVYPFDVLIGTHCCPLAQKEHHRLLHRPYFLSFAAACGIIIELLKAHQNVYWSRTTFNLAFLVFIEKHDIKCALNQLSSPSFASFFSTGSFLIFFATASWFLASSNKIKNKLWLTQSVLAWQVRCDTCICSRSTCILCTLTTNIGQAIQVK